jgi:hypothetical protein
MGNDRMLVAAMAEQCRDCLREAPCDSSHLPQPLHTKHLLWMCDQIESHADDWPTTKLHRWIGFIQCGLMASRALSFEQVKNMFDLSKAAYGIEGDTDLVDHLDSTSAFEIDIGGEG